MKAVPGKTLRPSSEGPAPTILNVAAVVIVPKLAHPSCNEDCCAQ